MAVDFWVAFVAGLGTGFSACIILMLSVFGTSLTFIEAKSKYIFVCIGLISGMIFAYLVVTIIAYYVFGLTQSLAPSIFNFIFAGILIFIGAWQIVESRKEQSLIFKTPEKVKTILRDFMEKNSGLYAFLIGVIFVLVKIPCYGGIYLTLLYDLQGNPLVFSYILIYLLGMIIPTIIILTAFRAGLEISKVDEFRLKYRTHLRILSGSLLIFLAIFLLFF